MHECVIRDMQEADLEQVGQLYSDMYREQKEFGMVMDLQESEMLSLLASQLKSKLHLLSVLESGDSIVGFISAGIVKLQKKYHLEDQSFIGFIHDIYIKHDYRKYGWAAKLLTKMEAGLHESGVGYVELQVLEGNPVGQKFWAEMGYKDVIRVMYKCI